MRIVSKVVLLVSLSVLIVMAVVGWVAFQQSKEALHREIDNLLTSNLDSAATDIDENSSDTKKTSEIIARNPAISRALFLDVSIGVNQILNQMLEIYPFYNYIMIVTLDGDVFAVTTIDKHGNKISGEELLGLNVKAPIFLERPIAPQTVVGDPTPDPYLSLLGIKPKISQWFVTPVFKGKAQLGWVLLSYDWQDELAALLASVRRELVAVDNPVIHVALVNEKGEVFAEPHFSNRKLIRSPDVVWKEKQLSFGKANMKLVIVSDRTKINEPLIRMRNSFVGLIVVSSIFLMGILYFILKRTFLEKLKLIHEGSKAFMSGDLSYRLPPIGRDELGLLASTFNEMGQSLQDASHKLELRVERRTAELKIANEKLLLEIAQHRQTAEELKESEEKYRIIFSKEKDCIALIDPDTFEILDANEASETLWGYSRQELLGMNTLDLTIEPESCRESIYTLSSLKGGAIVAGRHKKKNGEIVHVEISAVPITLKGRTLICQIVRDVSDRLRAEREKQELQAQLFQSQKTLALGTLVGGIAHDFNNMLQVIIGYCDLLLTRVNVDKSANKDLQTIIKTAKGGADLVKKLLLFGKEAPIRRASLDLNDQIRQLLVLMPGALPQKIDLQIDLTNEPTVIHADPNQMDQMVMNLAVNAAEAMPDGGQLEIATKIVRLDDEYCRFHHGVKPGKYVGLHVSDNGRGMDAGTLSRIFEPFFSTKERGSTRGTGLGLSVVQGIVEKHGGHITCESEPGKGTEFRIYFPVVETE